MRSFASRGRATLVGECGDGKSSLLNKIRDPNRSGQAASGLRSRGVTKEIKAYVGMPIAGREIDYFDTPGDGDMDVTPMDLLALIEQELRDRAVLVNKILVGPRDGFVDVNKTMSDVRMTGHWTTVCQTKKGIIKTKNNKTTKLDWL